MDAPGESTPLAVTSWLASAPSERVDAFHAAYTAAYAELKRMAHGQLRRMGRWSDTTVLVNEVFMKLCAGHAPAPIEHGHLMALSACAMRQVLVDLARQAGTDKRNGIHVSLDDAHGDAPTQGALEVLTLDRALQRLAEFDLRSARIVELRYFGGYTEKEAAGILGITDRTLRRDWRRARAFLQAELGS